MAVQERDDATIVVVSCFTTQYLDKLQKCEEVGMLCMYRELHFVIYSTASRYRVC